MSTREATVCVGRTALTVQVQIGNVQQNPVEEYLTIPFSMIHAVHAAPRESALGPGHSKVRFLAYL